jgi:hypothetical protein
MGSKSVCYCEHVQAEFMPVIFCVNMLGHGNSVATVAGPMSVLAVAFWQISAFQKEVQSPHVQAN